MNEELRGRYVRDLTFDLKQVGGARLELWLRPLWERLAGAQVNARGVNLQGAPVKGTLDAYWPDGSVSEASSDAKYFDRPYTKALHDFNHALQAAPGVKVVRLFCTQVAPPSVWTFYERANRSRIKPKGYELDLWDGKKIAEYIVDNLLTDDRYVTRVGDALPNLRRIAEQNAVSNRLPSLSAGYRGRQAEEADLLARLARTKSVVVSGFGGIGKSEFACAVALRHRPNVDQVIWVDGSKITAVDELRSHDVRLNGYRLNILSLLDSSKALLILDNVQDDLGLAQLDAACGAGSNVIVTSQVSFGPDPLQLGFIDNEDARAILSAGMPAQCPDDVLESVIAAVEGHPLVLRLLNQIGVRSQRWESIVRACEHIAGAADERRQTVADRILSQHLDVLGFELSVFKWACTASVDRVLFEWIAGDVGIEKLDRWALTARGQSDAVRIHDLVFASAKRLGERIHVEAENLKDRLENFLADHVAPKRLEFFRVVGRHRGLIECLLRDDPQPGALRYAYLHSRIPSEFDPVLLGDPEADATKDLRGVPRIWLLSVVEAIEADYRRVRDLGDNDAAKTTLTARLNVFERLLGDRRIPEDLRVIAEHHKAKSVLKLGRADEARAMFEAIVTAHPSMYPARLQLARLLETDPPRAKRLIFDIIEAERDLPGAVSTSVLIETLSSMRRRHLKTFVREMTEAYGPFMAAQLKAAACLGEDQPIRAFAAIGPEWSYHWPDLFLEVLSEIEVGEPEEAEDDDERGALGRVLSAAGKLLLRQANPSEAKLRFEQADKFFSNFQREPSPFARVQHSDVLLRLHRYADAATVLDAIPAAKRDPFWQLRRAEIHLDLGELVPARACIDAGLASAQTEYRSTFLNLKSDIQHRAGEPQHFDTLTEAIACCESPRYKAELTDKLALRTAGASAS
jgi:hypothetical protein